MKSRWPAVILIFCLVSLVSSTRAVLAESRPQPPAKSVVTQHHILPILLQHCTACHGAYNREAELDLRSKASMLKGGKAGPALIPGQPDASTIVSRIRSGACPPSKRLVEAGVKPVEPSALAKLIDWIAAGAPEEADMRDAGVTSEHPLIRDKDRDFWSFRPPAKAFAPKVRRTELVNNPIDAFVLSKLEGKGLTFAPEAPKPVLLRRVYFDLTGLSPTPDETDAFLLDNDAQAYEKLVDRLLASPRYGERWGRHWLDVAGYSDVEGRREQHLPRRFAYRYRDYVIQAFNADKPYNRFLLEQLAGDELADYEHAPRVTQEIHDNLVATAFLRMGPDPTWANITGFVPDRLEVMADSLDVFGSGVLGLTLKCARCHDHKFDPIPQRDYFRLVDIFKGAFDEYNWLKPDLRPFGGAGNSGRMGERSLPFVLTEERKEWEAHMAKLQRQIDLRNSALKEEEPRLREKFREAELSKLSESLREDIKKTLATPRENRTAAQVKLAQEHEKKLMPDRNELKKFDAGFKNRCDEVASLESQKRPEPRIAALWDRGDPSPTYIYRRGDYQRPGLLVKAGVPAVLSDGTIPFEIRRPWPGSRQTGRRLALARWLTSPNHPLTSRVMVNRIWKQHFGHGIVKSLGNFGKTGSAPTHPELLDWLANEFVQEGWRIKPLHRLILTSRTFRQSSSIAPEQLTADLNNELLSRMPLRRLDAEAVWDSLISAAGSLDETRFGPPIAAKTGADGAVTPGRTGAGWRRSIYSEQLRKDIPTLLDAFDLPQMNPNCLERGESIVAPQALHLMNDKVVRELASRFAERVHREAGGEPVQQIRRAFLIAFARPPSTEETAESSEFLNELAATREAESKAQANNPVDPTHPLSVLCHSLLNSAEFLYID